MNKPNFIKASGEDDINILKVEYISNHWLYHNQIQNLSLGDQILQMLQIKMTSIGRQPPMEDNLKIFQVEYLSNRWLNLTQIWNFILGDKTNVYKCFKLKQLPMEDDLKYQT